MNPLIRILRRWDDLPPVLQIGFIDHTIRTGFRILGLIFSWIVITKVALDLFRLKNETRPFANPLFSHFSAFTPTGTFLSPFGDRTS